MSFLTFLIIHFYCFSKYHYMMNWKFVKNWSFTDNLRSTGQTLITSRPLPQIEFRTSTFLRTFTNTGLSKYCWKHIELL